MTRADKAHALCASLRRLWLQANEGEREAIAGEIAALTQRDARGSLSERVLAEMAVSNG